MKMRPADFWALTPNEWAMLAGEEEGALTTADLAALAADYPDREEISSSSPLPSGEGPGVREQPRRDIDVRETRRRRANP